MKKGSFRDNIEKLVRLLPRPMMNGKLITRSRNFWSIMEEYGEEDGIVVLNKTTEQGQDPLRQHPKMARARYGILSAQVSVGKDGRFELSQFLDGPESETMTEEEEILPERLSFVETKLLQCPSFLDFGERRKVWIKPVFVPVLEKLLLRPKTGTATTSLPPPQSS